MKDLFKSKGFTAGFVLLSLLIIALLTVLIYLLSGRGPGSQPVFSSYSGEERTPEIRTDPEEDITDNPETVSQSETESESETETEESSSEEDNSVENSELPGEQTVFRPLLPDEEPKYPVLNKVIPESGTLSVHRPEGLIFHTLPQFDGPEDNDNIIVNDGEFPVIGKIFVLGNDGTPSMMLKTENNYFVTSDPGLVTYRASRTTFAPNSRFMGTYGSGDGKGIIVQVYAEDGNHVCFTIFNDMNGIQTPALSNVIAEYEDAGWGNFEFKYNDGKSYDGMIEFHQAAGTIQVEINLPIACEFESGSKSYILLGHD